MNKLMSLTEQELIALCVEYGGMLKVPVGIDPAQVLWSIAGKETTFGQRCIPLHEAGYCYGSKSYRADKRLRDMTEAWGCAAHCSYGPWQIMFYNAYLLNSNIDPVILLTDAAYCAQLTVMKLNTIIATQKPIDIREIADAWNSGSARDDLRPLVYMDAVAGFYAQKMPSAQKEGNFNA